MKPLTIAATALAGTTMFAAAPANAAQPFGPSTFQNLASVFAASDLDRNSSLSSREYVMLRTNMVDRAWVRNYSMNAYPALMPDVVANFSRLDRDDNGAISRQEFMAIPTMRAAAASADRWDWRPEYVTLNYYLTANRIGTDRFIGQPVVNLDGEELGRIRQIARHEDTGRYYALVTMREKVADPTPTQLRAEVIGVPLNEMLLSADAKSVMLSHEGERFLLMDEEQPEAFVENLRPVESLYAV